MLDILLFRRSWKSANNEWRVREIAVDTFINLYHAETTDPALRKKIQCIFLLSPLLDHPNLQRRLDSEVKELKSEITEEAIQKAFEIITISTRRVSEDLIISSKSDVKHQEDIEREVNIRDYFSRLSDNLKQSKFKELQLLQNFVGGILAYLNSDFEEALQFFEQDIQAMESKFGPKSKETANAYSRIMLADLALGRWEKADQHNAKAIQIVKDSTGENSSALASIYLSLGLLYESASAAGKALKMYE